MPLEGTATAKRASEADDADTVIDFRARRRQRAGITFENIANLRIWVGYRLEQRDEAGPLTKVPYNLASRRRAALTTRHMGCRTTEEWTEEQRKHGKTASVELVLGVTVGDGRVIVGVDLDSCLDANGLPAEWAEDVIGRFGSYSEISPPKPGQRSLRWLPVPICRLSAQ